MWECGGDVPAIAKYPQAWVVRSAPVRTDPVMTQPPYSPPPPDGPTPAWPIGDGQNLWARDPQAWLDTSDPNEGVGSRHHTVPAFYLRYFADKQQLLVRRIADDAPRLCNLPPGPASTTSLPPDPGSRDSGNQLEAQSRGAQVSPASLGMVAIPAGCGCSMLSPRTIGVHHISATRGACAALFSDQKDDHA